MICSLDLEDELRVEAETARSKPIVNEGGRHDRMGIAFEKIVGRRIRQGNSRILGWLGIPPGMVKDVAVGSREVKKYTDNEKADLVVVTEDGPVCFSLKCTGVDMVGALETSVERIGNSVRMSNTEYISFERFAENGYRVRGMKGHNVDIITRYFRNHFRDFMNYVVRGKNMDGDGLQIRYIVFYDKQRRKLYMDTVEEYINLVADKGSKGTFCSKMSITYTSGKRKRFKFKIKNPVRLLT